MDGILATKHQLYLQYIIYVRRDKFRVKKDKSTLLHTLAVSGATPKPESSFTAKALVTQDVIVSGTVALWTTLPVPLQNIHNKLSIDITKLQHSELWPILSNKNIEC